jgi:hypothetical protein
MSETVSVDLSPIIEAINVVNGNMRVVAQHIDEVGSRVDAVAQEQADTRQLVEKVLEEFRDYREVDEWAQSVSKAREELQLFRQEFEKEFGRHDKVRDATIGILQAVDVAGVRTETIRTAAEEGMIYCQRYWLAPALVALSGWIADNREVAEKMIAEAIRRDDSKTSLLFALVCRRAQRMEACITWLKRYLQIQNPMAIDREAAVMINAIANGVFGGAALNTCTSVIDGWLTELEQQAGFADEQRRRWAEVLDVMRPPVASDEYPTLRRYSPTWPKLEVALSAARRNQVVQSFFEKLFTGEIGVTRSLEAAVDDLLFSGPPSRGLLKDFEDEELPLRRKIAYRETVIEVDALPGRPRGKKAEVDSLYKAGADALKEQTSFAAILTNSAMFPEKYGATLASRRYAVSRSRQWIIAGFNDLTVRDRALVPTEAEIGAGSWKGNSRDGSNEPQLSADLFQHYANRIEQAVNAVGIAGGTWAALVIGGLFGLLLAAQGGGAILMGILIMAAAGAYFYFKYQNLENVRNQTKASLEKERDEADRILKAALAELTDLRREISKEDGKADDVVELLKALSSPQFILKRPEQARAISH